MILAFFDLFRTVLGLIDFKDSVDFPALLFLDTLPWPKIMELTPGPY
jgi:hypothetical protein